MTTTQRIFSPELSNYKPDPQPEPDGPPAPDPDPQPDPVAASGAVDPTKTLEKMYKNKDHFGPAGFALGHSRSEWSLDGSTAVTNGVHVDVPFVWNKLSLFVVTPSLTVESDLGFPGVAFTGGVGPGVHFLLPGIFQLYGKLMVDGHLAAIEGDGLTGWTASAVGGGAAGFGLTAYLEYRQAVAGSENLHEERRVSGGLRVFF